MKHINKLSLGALLLCALVISACASGAAVRDARNKLDWAGTYVGQIPSASGSGIDVRLTLRGNGTYELNEHYVGRPNPDFMSTGFFTWNSAGTVITLNASERAVQYQVGENTLRQLDLEGKVITGNLAALYLLKKE